MHSQNLPVIALIGRPNVGKSTLFNRLTGSRDALVSDMPGLTRDRQYSLAKYGKHKYILVDTGGLEPVVDSATTVEVIDQTKSAIIEADAVILVVDGKSGLLDHDKEIANYLRELDKTVYIAVNKTENIDTAYALGDFYALGFQNLYSISASHGKGIASLISDVLSQCPISDVTIGNDTTDDVDSSIIFALIGRPNVGKSTLANTLLGEKRVVVANEEGTTRDSIKIALSDKHGQSYTMIDTAGIRKKSKVDDKIEKFSAIKSLNAIAMSQVAVLVLDATCSISHQDLVIAGHILDAGRAMVIAVNKWDKLNTEAKDVYKEELKQKLHFLDFVEVVYLSALQSRGVESLFKAIGSAHQSFTIKFPTAKLTGIIIEAVRRQSPPFKGRIKPKIKYAHQGGSSPPVIILHGNNLDYLDKSYHRYLERIFRNTFNLVGTKVAIQYKIHTNPFDKS